MDLMLEVGLEGGRCFILIAAANEHQSNDMPYRV
jgi:hypothetical protein